ncbi:hypothetical protein OMP38_03900 [Cohnella ginsengisoli]|uniref:Uncharacterized protein n=1 Tax=Cohnella ginsengisoli TaxID=425004 RepID=A0A9X4KDV2_9BACL|nr:hypothetical protein [Cohnella ginsengisoli]MDG0790090.1 hypothetical protein [Cohnella ginsengisoli]
MGDELIGKEKVAQELFLKRRKRQPQLLVRLPKQLVSLHFLANALDCPLDGFDDSIIAFRF